MTATKNSNSRLIQMNVAGHTKAIVCYSVMLALNDYIPAEESHS